MKRGALVLIPDLLRQVDDEKTRKTGVCMFDGARSCPMAASSGFRSSLGHNALGNAVCIALAHRRGHQTGWRMRYIHSSLPTFSLIFLAKAMLWSIKTKDESA
jgi:hypothetical protein